MKCVKYFTTTFHLPNTLIIKLIHNMGEMLKYKIKTIKLSSDFRKRHILFVLKISVGEVKISVGVLPQNSILYRS